MRHSINKYSAQIGRDPSLVQGAGGNVSWKDGDTLNVKASGTWLADAEERDIFVPVDLADLRSHYSQGQFDAKPLVLGQSELRPSIETLLHAVMPQKVVVHTHPIDALAFLVKTDCAELLDDTLGNEINWELVDYHKPGPDLGAAVHAVIQRAGTAPPPEVIFLANHGVIVAGADLDTIERIYRRLQQLLAQTPRTVEAPPRRDIPLALKNLEYELPADESIQKLAFDSVCQAIMLKHWALYPDHVVFLGAQPNIFSTPEQLIADADNSEPPEYAIIPQCGVFVKAGLNRNKLAMLKCFEEVLARLSESDDLNSLSGNDVSQLLDWDAEKYRSRIAK